jgi:hypothetical protein
LQVKRKAFRLVIQQVRLGTVGQPEGTQLIPVAGTQQSVLFQRAHDSLFVTGAARKLVEQIGWEIA